MARAEAGIDAVRAGDRRALARAITLLESTRDEDRAAAEKLLRDAMPHSGGAIRLGISGAPGVGKSTFIEAFGNSAIARGERVAVLTIDPTSGVSGGSILGDKTRMASLAANPNAFIRPSPAGRALGGVARRTQEALLVCEAANYDLIIVETVGVGQSETLAAAMTDIFLLLLPPAGGDALQGIKRGIMELADIIVVNKNDGALAKQAALAASDIRHALGVMRPRIKNWRTPVLLASALENTGIGEVREQIDACRKLLESGGALQARRREQAREWLWNETREALLAELKKDPAVGEALEVLLRRVGDGELPASVAARELAAMFMRSAA
ncbi:MAG: methylmalonyl Co-A mutase-associated GTPase MeaB [Gammaproteobacteria bacterium]|nr:methylmalonyl Co-A mutase-associated GTPase MeaB [Gammaproteobacteria bacterium]CAJ2376237.1 MAG: methylmalonyl-CoA mutase-interacting GTPase YgfD [Arenicellales bacterium IbO2]MDA7961756.1 methylmalonyl Co-A mutase-associated GTPase MeaB [Gammaproteobacteria bacterium]MDA7968019.1 methylmalonyl Co-A mutase-associated GTPase MeaB [Gammaproteobacteria bacterium]MDA7970214.1 methylmalonyl Co-A mutase-associated GTPase MeaB [Gammaproteobacteria bacterium]